MAAKKIKHIVPKNAQKVSVDVVLDLSGSTIRDRQDLFEVGDTFAKVALRDNIPIAINGGDDKNYEFNLSDLSQIFEVGGGGTAARAWIQKQRERLTNSTAEHKWAFVVTDGYSFNPEAVYAQVQLAASEGIRVFGFAFDCHPSDMNREFGKGNWTPIDSYDKIPKVAWKLINKNFGLRGFVYRHLGRKWDRNLVPGTPQLLDADEGSMEGALSTEENRPALSDPSIVKDVNSDLDSVSKGADLEV